MGSEFQESIIDGDWPRKVSFQDLNAACNRDDLDPKDGLLLKVCDQMAAYLEAYTALRNGIASASLSEAAWRIKKQLMDYNKDFPELKVAALLADFD